MASVRTLTPQEAEKADELWHQQISKAIADETCKLDELSAYVSELRETSSLLETLPDRINYDVMVPFGRVAMFPGQMIHTNELLVLLGQDTYVEASAKQTRAILKRREEYTEAQMDAVNRQLDSLKSRLSFSEPSFNEDGEEVKDIVEVYDEAIHGPLDRPALPRRESPRQPRSAQEAEEDEAWWRAFREQAAVAAREEMSELAQEAAAQAQRAAPEQVQVAASPAAENVAQEGLAASLGFDPFEEAPDSDDDVSPRPQPAAVDNEAVSTSEAATGQTGGVDASGSETGSRGEGQARPGALEAELARLMAAFETAVPDEPKANGDREIVVPSEAAQPSHTRARSPLIEDLGPIPEAGSTPREQDNASTQAGSIRESENPSREQSSRNAQAGEPSSSALHDAQRVSTSRSADAKVAEAPRRGVRRGFFDSRKTAAKPKGILKNTPPAESPAEAPKPADATRPRLSQKLLARSEPTLAQLAAFSGVVEERVAQDSKRQEPSPSASSASDGQQSTAAQQPAHMHQQASKLEEAKRVASLASAAEEDEAVMDMQYIDTEINKPISKFKARLLKSRGEL